MCRVCSLIGGLVMVVTLAGCSESPPESGTVPYKPTTSPAIEALNKQMSDQARKGITANKEMPKPGMDSKSGETKPAADTGKPEEKK